MNAYGLWMQIMAGHPVRVVVQLAQRASVSVEEVIGQAARDWAVVNSLPAGETVDSITAKLLGLVVSAALPVTPPPPRPDPPVLRYH